MGGAAGAGREDVTGGVAGTLEGAAGRALGAVFAGVVLPAVPERAPDAGALAEAVAGGGAAAGGGDSGAGAAGAGLLGGVTGGGSVGAATGAGGGVAGAGAAGVGVAAGSAAPGRDSVMPCTHALSSISSATAIRHGRGKKISESSPVSEIVAARPAPRVAMPGPRSQRGRIRSPDPL